LRDGDPFGREAVRADDIHFNRFRRTDTEQGSLIACQGRAVRIAKGNRLPDLRHRMQAGLYSMNNQDGCISVLPCSPAKITQIAVRKPGLDGSEGFSDNGLKTALLFLTN